MEKRARRLWAVPLLVALTIVGCGQKSADESSSESQAASVSSHDEPANPEQPSKQPVPAPDETVAEIDQPIEAVPPVLPRPFAPSDASAEESATPDLSAADPPPADASVTVLIAGRLADDAHDRVADALLELVTDERLALVEPARLEDGMTRIRVSPVPDIEAFASSIDFAEVTAVDAEGRTLTVKLKRSGRE